MVINARDGVMIVELAFKCVKQLEMQWAELLALLLSKPAPYVAT